MREGELIQIKKKEERLMKTFKRKDKNIKSKRIVMERRIGTQGKN